jgi:hypothetical protein
METLQFETQSHQQVIPKALLESLFEPPQINPHNAQQSPRMGKNKQQKVQTQGGPSEPFMLSSKLPSAHVTDFALPPALQSYLEVSLSTKEDVLWIPPCHQLTAPLGIRNDE